jgi:hypothetical protein
MPEQPSSDSQTAEGMLPRWTFGVWRGGGHQTRGFNGSMPFGQRPHAWDEEERAVVMEFLDQHLSASAIAAQFHITRNAAIGRIARDHELHDHYLRVTPKKSKPPKRPPLKAKASPPPPAEPVPVPGRMRLVPLLELGRNECRWPVTQDLTVTGGYLFCGRRTADGEVYCARHKAMATPRGGS